MAGTRSGALAAPGEKLLSGTPRPQAPSHRDPAARQSRPGPGRHTPRALPEAPAEAAPAVQTSRPGATLFPGARRPQSALGVVVLALAAGSPLPTAPRCRLSPLPPGTRRWPPPGPGLPLPRFSARPSPSASPARRPVGRAVPPRYSRRLLRCFCAVAPGGRDGALRHGGGIRAGSETPGQAGSAAEREGGREGGRERVEVALPRGKVRGRWGDARSSAVASILR